MPKARAHLVVSGRVQGVFYRAYTEQAARSLGLAGWVRNMPGGNVEAVFEGEEVAVKNAVKFCREGPPAARVENMDVEWSDFQGDLNSFSVKYY
jgi:acylphosphatase